VAGSIRGAHAGALFYSLIATAKANELCDYESGPEYIYQIIFEGSGLEPFVLFKSVGNRII
jgi:hypothetical protein